MVLPQRHKGRKENCYWVNGFTAKAQRHKGKLLLGKWFYLKGAKAQRKIVTG
jgi:hypothetical protein